MDNLFSIVKKHKKENYRDDAPPLYIVNIGNEVYEIEIIYDRTDPYADIEKISEPAYEVEVEDFLPDAIFIQQHTLKKIGKENIPDTEKERVLRMIQQSLKNNADNLKVIIE